MDRRVEIKTTVLQSCSVSVSGSTDEEVVSGLSFYHSLPEVCPVCQERLIFFHRKPTAKAEYYGLRCLGREPHEANFGDSQRFPGSLYYKGDHTFKPIPGGAHSENEGGDHDLPVTETQFVSKRPPVRATASRSVTTTINIDDPTMKPAQLREELSRLIDEIAGELQYIKLKGTRRTFTPDLLKTLVNQKYKVTDGIESLSPVHLREVYNWLRDERAKEVKREAITAELAPQQIDMGTFAKDIAARYGGRELDDLSLDELIVVSDELLADAIPF